MGARRIRTIDAVTAIDTVIFDLGAVLIDWDPNHLYRDVIPDRAERDWFLAKICTHDWNYSLDAGRSVPEAVAELAAQHPDHQREIRAWWDRWPDMLAGPIDGTVDIAHRLRSDGYRLLALTNFAAETWPRAVEKLPFLGTMFDGVVVSGIEKVAKPDPAIYHLLLDRYDVDPATAVFIDDRADNVATAEALGIRSHVFVSPGGLEEWLREVLAE